ncbi:MAG: Intimin [Candidatus Erwinia impunctatus]|nr:Intimin [Culicoides impunctatus]
MRNQTARYYSTAQRVTARLLLCIQLLSPLLLTTATVARAVEQHQDSVQMLDTLNGIGAVVGQSSPVQASAAASSAISAPVDSLPGITSLPQNSALPAGVALPSLGSSELVRENAATLDTMMAQGASQTAQLLSTQNAVDASINYARGIGENLVNQQINDWLSQLGRARVQFGSNKTGDADLLIPLLDNPNSLFFTQQGIRANEDRTTVNLGLGYRQYEDGWMWGVNSFYDYDLTGSNARAGVGGELWANYLKFAANGYFGLTDWHQSKLSGMEDYDERPANGYDVRVEGYLPAYPQLGAFAKYEQYFGRGVALTSGTSPDDLKEDPSVTTLGVTYTPFPLLTLKGQTSRGDSNDSRIALELNYRLGLSFASQLDPANVDLMRSLAGNRYDFVDRNYTIVMQYRKQDLLNISLPPRMSGEAAQTLPVTLNVNKAKYGLKSVNWSAPELVANGGKLEVTSPTTLQLTLPAYIFGGNSTAGQSYRVTAVGTDSKGNPSNTAEMWVDVRESQERVVSLDLEMSISASRMARSTRSLASASTVPSANDLDQYLVTATVANDKSERLADRELTFQVEGFSRNEAVTLSDSTGNTGRVLSVMTDSSGQAGIKIRSQVAGEGRLVVKMRNGNSNAATLRFSADGKSAKITQLEVIRDGAKANDSDTNEVRATVRDQFDNVVEGAQFTPAPSLSNGAVFVTMPAATDAQGLAVFTLKNSHAGITTLSATLNGESRTAETRFVADVTTAYVAGLEVKSQSGATVSTTTGNEVVVTVTDEKGNRVAGAPVAVTLPSLPAGYVTGYTTVPSGGITDENGQLTFTVYNTQAGTFTYGFQVSGSQSSANQVKNASLTFLADGSGAKVGPVTLTEGVTEQVVGNSFGYRAQLVDQYNNILPGAGRSVSWQHDSPVAGVALTDNGVSETDAQGRAVIRLGSQRVAEGILVSARVGSEAWAAADSKVRFTSDTTLATLVVDVVKLDGTVESLPANNSDAFSYTATLKDQYGNPVNAATAGERAKGIAIKLTQNADAAGLRLFTGSGVVAH